MVSAFSDQYARDSRAVLKAERDVGLFLLIAESGLMLASIDHVNLVVNDLDRMIAFYRDALSLEVTKHVTISGEWIDRVHQRKPLKKLILDMDSSVSETYGQQEGTAYNGHFECMCYHPLFLFNQNGDLERAILRRGNHASAKYWRRVMLPVVARYRHLDIPKFFRGDAAFARPALYRLLEKEG